MGLRERIEEARERTRRDPAEIERERREREAARRLLLTTDAVALIDASLPDELREFVHYAGQDRDDQFPSDWQRGFFTIEAPEMLTMAFTAVEDMLVPEPPRPLVVNSMRVGDKEFGKDWDAAIVEAAGPATSWK